MRGSHAPSLATLVKRALVEARLERGTAILCACSGGPDSNAMLHVLARVAPKHGIRVEACGVDHGLRVEADAELDMAERLAESMGVRFERVRLQLKPGGNLMERAREARYRALEEMRERLGCDLVATAHTADDRAETLLMRLLRGAGPRGLAVLPVRSGRLLRPLVRARRSDVVAHLRRNEITFASDPSNLDTRFLRVRVRAEVLPLLEGLSPTIVESLGALADALEGASSGDPLEGLGRRQRAVIQRAKTAGRRKVAVRVDDCREVLVSLTEAAPVITQVTSVRSRRPKSG